MSRVAVFSRVSNNYRTVSIGGGRGKNNHVNAWINFDYFKTERRESKRAKKGYVEEVVEAGTDSVSVDVYRTDEGKALVNFSVENLSSDRVQVSVCGVLLRDLLRVYNELKEVKKNDN